MKKTLRFITTILLSAVILVSPLCEYEKAQATSADVSNLLSLHQIGKRQIFSTFYLFSKCNKISQ